MAERKSAADFVARIVKDPANPPQTVMLTGYVGASSEKAHTRLYFDPGLNSYVEIPDDAILHSQDSGDPGGLGATHLWVRRDAELIYGPAGAQRPKGKFLEGPIMQAVAPVTIPVQVCATPPQTVLGCPTHAPFLCPQTQIGCPTHAPFLCPTPPVVCASAHIGCPTHAPFLCPTPPVVCASAHIGCPTHAPFLCPTPPVVCASAHLGCPTHAPFLCPNTLAQCPTQPVLCAAAG